MLRTSNHPKPHPLGGNNFLPIHIPLSPTHLVLYPLMSFLLLNNYLPIKSWCLLPRVNRKQPPCLFCVITDKGNVAYKDHPKPHQLGRSNFLPIHITLSLAPSLFCVITFYQLSHDICYQGSIENNLLVCFVLSLTRIMSRISDHPKPHPRWEPLK